MNSEKSSGLKQWPDGVRKGVEIKNMSHTIMVSMYLVRKLMELTNQGNLQADKLDYIKSVLKDAENEHLYYDQNLFSDILTEMPQIEETITASDDQTKDVKQVTDVSDVNIANIYTTGDDILNEAKTPDTETKNSETPPPLREILPDINLPRLYTTSPIKKGETLSNENEKTNNLPSNKKVLSHTLRDNGPLHFNRYAYKTNSVLNNNHPFIVKPIKTRDNKTKTNPPYAVNKTDRPPFK